MNRTIIIFFILQAVFFPEFLNALTTGEKVNNPVLRTAENTPSAVPFFGEKNLLLFYIDPDVHEQNDIFLKSLSEEIKSPPDFLCIGIINLRDAPLMPDPIVRYMIRREIKKTNSTILTDPDRILSKSWNLGDCNGSFVVILIDKNKKVRFLKKGKLNSNEIRQVLDTIKSLTGTNGQSVIDKNPVK